MADRFMPVTGGITYIEHGGADEEVKIRVKAIDNAESGLKGAGRVFYVSPNGNNENEGTSPDSPCRTVEAVRSLCYWLEPGDTVLFERGGIYRMTFDLDLISGVSYGAYGNGEKPVILGSYINYAKEEIWKRVDGNIWAIPYFPHTDAGLMVFDGGSSSGIKCFSMEEMTHNNYYFHDLDEHCLYMYSDKGNPALLYKEIEIGTMTRFFHLPFGTHDINIDNIDFKVSGLFAIRADGGCKNISITNCAFSWIGGSLFPNRSNRFGNAIEFSTSCENVLVENCRFFQLYDSGVSFQIGKGPFKNFTVRGNVFEYTGMAGFEWWGEHLVGGGEIPLDDTVIENILIENNIMHMNGYGWSGITRHPCHIRGTWAPRDYTNLKNFTVKNNIFDCSRGFIFACAWSGIPKEYITENNTYYQKASVKLNENDPGYPAFDMEYKHRTYAENQEELEAAVRAVEPHAKLVKWLG